MKLNQLFLLHSSCCSFHGSTCVSLMAVAFWRLCHSAIEKQAFLCLPDRSAATLVACLDIDVIYLIFDMQFSMLRPVQMYCPAPTEPFSNHRQGSGESLLTELASSFLRKNLWNLNITICRQNKIFFFSQNL